MMTNFESKASSGWTVLLASAALTAITMSAPPAIAADDTATKTPDEKAQQVLYNHASSNGVFVFDYGVPSSPALNLIGLTPDKTTVQTSLKPFVLSLPQLVSGAADQSAALDLAPFWLLSGSDSTSYDQYVGEGPYAGKSDYWLRLKYRFRTDAALFTGDNGGGDASKAKPSQIAVGFSLPLLDDSDPLTAVDPSTSNAGPVWKSCIQESQDKDIKVYFQIAADMRAQFGAAKHLQDIVDTGGVPTDKQLSDFEKGTGTAQAASTLRAQNDIAAAREIVASGDKASAEETAANTAALKAITACTTKANNIARFAPSLNFGAGVDAQGTPGS